MLKDLKLKKVYDSNTSNLIRDFYIPVLENSITYKRITGYFSAGSLLAASDGIFKLVESGGTYELIMGNTIGSKDYKALQDGVSKSEEFLDLDLGELIKSKRYKNKFKLLSWMIANNKLKIKIAFVKDNSDSIFHEKIGIFKDKDKNSLSFSGSINETSSGWISNVEEFKVFRSWSGEEIDYHSNDTEKFERYWSGLNDSFFVVDLPKALECKFLKETPSTDELGKIIISEKNDVPKYSTLRNYQKKAVLNWKDNDYKGLFEMATGTGKTITALAAARMISNKNLISIIAVPQTHLIKQWEDEVKKEIPNFTIHRIYGGNPKWRKELFNVLNNFRDGFSKKNNVIITTYSTLSSEYFLKTFQNLFESKREYLIIADEMHSFGSKEHKKGMLDEFSFRLGLSATPTRWFDDLGSQESLSYFNKVVFEYSLKKAIADGYLTKYKYYPEFVNLTQEEYSEYKRLTYKLLNLYSNTSEGDKKSSYLEQILIKRSRVLKKCENKFFAFEKIVKKLIRLNDLNHLLVYFDSKEQLLVAQNILNENGVISHTFTQEETDNQRENLLKKFDSGTYDCLLAMKCLDEGVDIPSTRTAIILASSTNPKEYIQRRGRILRKYKNKKLATIYDFIVEPPINDQESILKLEQKILYKELKRVSEFLETAENQSEVLSKIIPKMLKYGVYLD